MNAAGGDLSPILKRLAAGASLTEEEAARAFAAIMSGTVSPVQMAAFLAILAVRGPAVAEIVAGARVLRANMVAVAAPDSAIDLCGTGGDHHGTLNLSTAASFVVAACGVPVAKHGNRAMSSRTGAADVLEALGVAIGSGPEAAERSLKEANLCFLFAQAHHPAMRHVAPVRRELGFRTIFNLLGPLSNPAGVRRQLLGVFDAIWLEPLAQTLNALGAEKAWIVHGSDGLDEITITGPTSVAALEHGQVRTFTIAPEDVGLPRSGLESIKGGEPETNAKAVRAVLRGERSAFRDVVVLNAAAGLVVADKARDLKEGAALAARALDTGAANDALERLIRSSRGERA